MKYKLNCECTLLHHRAGCIGLLAAFAQYTAHLFYTVASLHSALGAPCTLKNTLQTEPHLLHRVCWLPNTQIHTALCKSCKIHTGPQAAAWKPLLHRWLHNNLPRWWKQNYSFLNNTFMNTDNFTNTNTFRSTNTFTNTLYQLHSAQWFASRWKQNQLLFIKVFWSNLACLFGKISMQRAGGWLNRLVKIQIICFQKESTNANETQLQRKTQIRMKISMQIAGGWLNRLVRLGGTPSKASTTVQVRLRGAHVHIQIWIHTHAEIQMYYGIQQIHLANAHNSWTNGPLEEL